jgi:ATP-dependent Zn protease
MYFEDDNSSGVSGDLSSASRVAALMEGSFGMGGSLTSAMGTRQNAGGGPANAISVSLRENRETIEKNLAQLYDEVAGLLEEQRDKVLELAAVLEQRKNISGDEVAEIMGSAPGSRTMREPKGWQAVSDIVADERQREALLRSGRGSVPVDASDSEESG